MQVSEALSHCVRLIMEISGDTGILIPQVTPVTAVSGMAIAQGLFREADILLGFALAGILG